MGRRIRWLAVVLLLCFTLVLLQLVNLQFRKAPALANSPNNPRNQVTRYHNDRGFILAADGQTVLAKSVPATSGSYDYQREYPGGSLYSQIVGYSSIEYGTAGVEYEYNQELTPHAQPIETLGQLLNPPPPATDNVTLTVEPYLQQAAAQALAANKNANKDGAVVVLDVHTGAVLAMYSSPTFDPAPLADPDIDTEKAAYAADFETKDAEQFYPGVPMATHDPFLPGSTFKVVTSAAVYNLKPSLVNFDFPEAPCTPAPGTPGAIQGTTHQICNDGTTPQTATKCGGTMVQMLPASCDPGYAMLGIAVGGQTLYQQATQFGFDSKPPIDLPSSWVSTSNFPTPDQFASNATGEGGLALAAFGQGDVTSTALQNAMVAAGVADGGTVMTPHVMASIHTADGKLVKQYKPTVYQQAMSPSAAQSVNALMQSVVTEGTADNVGFDPSLDAAVKTGTAQSGNNAEETHDWMIGFAPANNPQVAVAVVVPNQPKSNSGAEVAGPIVNAMLEAALHPPAGQ